MIVWFGKLSGQKAYRLLTRTYFHVPTFFFLLLSGTFVFSPTVLWLATEGATQAILKAILVPYFILIGKCEGIIIHVIPVLKLCVCIYVYIKSVAVRMLKQPLAVTYGPIILLWRACVLSLPLILN